MTKKDEIERILKNASFEASFKIKMTAKWQYCLQYLFVAWVRPCVADWTVRTTCWWWAMENFAANMKDRLAAAERGLSGGKADGGCNG